MKIDTLLSSHDIKPTRQRRAIANCLFPEFEEGEQHSAQHLSAESILEQVNQAGVVVSKATVYNTLRVFVSQGILREVMIDPQRVLFDTNTEHHHHVLNIDTGAIRDINLNEIDLAGILPDELGLQPGETLKGVDLTFKVCRADPAD